MESFLEPAAATASLIHTRLCALATGDFIRARQIGRSVCGRPIMALEFGTMDHPTLLIGGIHGMEWASALVALRLAQQTAVAVQEHRPLYDINLRAALAAQGAVLLPLLNPDGYEIRREGRGAALRTTALLSRFDDSALRRWQANANGVDLNHNFNAGFWKARAMVRAAGITRRGPTRYGGPYPLSEPESRAAKDACVRYRPRALYTLHSQGEEIYWRYGRRTPDNSKTIASLLADLTGYQLCEPDLIASHAGLKDWFIKRFRRPGFTIELGLGQNPLPYADFEAIWQRVDQALYAAITI